MEFRQRWQTLRGRLFFRLMTGVLAIALPVIAGSSLLLTYESGQKVEADASGSAASAAKSAAQRLDSWLAERRGDMQVLSRLVGGRLDDTAFADAQLQSVAAAYDAYETIYVLDPGGRMLLASRPDARFESAGQDWFARAHTQSVVTSLAVEGGKLTWWVAEPIKNAAGQTVGVVAGDLKEPKLSELLFNFDDDPNSQLQLVDRDHHLLYSEAYGKINDSAELLAKFNLHTTVSSPAVDRGLAGENGSTTFRDDQGQEYLGGYARPTHEGWAVITVEKTSSALASVDSQRNRALLLFVLAAAVLSLFSVRFARQVSRPIVALSEVAQQVGRGNLDVRATPAGASEVSGLGTAFNTMVARLQRMIDGSRAVSAEVATSATELSSASEELAATTTEQSAVVTETSSSMEELARTSYSIADTMDRIAAQAGDTRENLEQAQMDIQRSSERTTVLAERVQEINKVLGLIGEVADQTNLLALNAAIEAARAGEAGRGFAVVADEVRRLAERSKASAAEISEIIGSAQNETNATVMAMEKGAKQTEQALGLMQQVAEATSQVSMTTQQQRSATEQVQQAMEQLAAASRQLSATATQMAAAAAGQVALADRLERSARDTHDDDTEAGKR